MSNFVMKGFQGTKDCIGDDPGVGSIEWCAFFKEKVQLHSNVTKANSQLV